MKLKYIMTTRSLLLNSFLLLTFVLSGCSVHENGPRIFPHNLAYSSASIKDNASWWTFRFKNHWPKGTKAKGALDLLIANEILLPVLEEQGQQITYWRFHRRAAPDVTGHQFSFYFYSTAKVAAAVYKSIEDNRILQSFLATHYIESVSKDDVMKPHSSSIASISDKRWTSDLQKNWPVFMTGVSSLWLGLIVDAAAQIDDEQKEPQKLLNKYQIVDQRITAIWRNEGQHALLHHMSAMFGYQPLLIKKEIAF